MGFLEKFLETFLQNDFNFLTKKQIARRMNLKGFETQAMGNALDELVKCGELVLLETKYVLPKRIGAKIGKISASTRGFGFFVCEGESEDLFIPPHKMAGAMHGDTVLAVVEKKGQGGEGRVIQIVERATTHVVGTYESRGRFGFVVPDEKKLDDIYIGEHSSFGAKHGQKVVALITKYPTENKSAEANIVEVLGNPFDAGMDILSIIRAFNLFEEFPKNVLDSAKKVGQTVLEQELFGRQDFRSDTVVTIDGEDAKDLDDAVSLEMEDGFFKLSVHIADVAHYVTMRSPIDKEAEKRGTSVYFADRVLPMLPRELSNGICSLTSGTDKLTLSCIMHIDQKGDIQKSQIVEGVINTRHRMTYNEVSKILENDKKTRQKYADVCPMLELMNELSEILSKKRQQRGAIEFELSECKIIIDESGKAIDIVPYPKKDSNRIIEEFMLVANETVAKTFFDAQVPIVYRVHEPPTAEKMTVLKSFVEALGLTFSGGVEGVRPKTIQSLLLAAEKTDYKNMLSRIALRSMQKAKYSQDNMGHFGLAAKFYCHFTSPIRRYPDLVTHRMIKYFLKNGSSGMEKYKSFVQTAAQTSSVRERYAEEAEREVENLKKAEYMQQHIGEEFEGVVSGVSDFGIFVELENTVEGLVRLESLPPDKYTYDDMLMRLVGTKSSFRLGDKQKIRVLKCDLSMRKIEFVLA